MDVTFVLPLESFQEISLHLLYLGEAALTNKTTSLTGINLEFRAVSLPKNSTKRYCDKQLALKR